MELLTSTKDKINFFDKNLLTEVKEGIPPLLDNKFINVNINDLDIGFNLFYMRPWSDYEFEFIDGNLEKASKEYADQLSKHQYSGLIGKLEKDKNNINISMFLSNTKSHQYLLGTMHEYGLEKTIVEELGMKGIFVPIDLLSSDNSFNNQEGTNVLIRWSYNEEHNYYNYFGWRRRRSSDKIARNVSKQVIELYKIIDKYILPEHMKVDGLDNIEYRVSGPTYDLENLTFRE